MFLLKKGDKVKLTKQARELLGKQLFDALSEEKFTVIEITTDNSCEEKNTDCTCDKFITVKNGPISLHSLVSDELSLVTIKEECDFESKTISYL